MGDFIHGGGFGSGLDTVGGWGFYSDDKVTGATGQTIANSSSVFTTLTNNAALFEVEELPVDALASLWDKAAAKIAPYNLHDTIHARFRMTVANYSGSSPFIELCIEAGGSSGKIECVTIPLLKAGSDQVVKIEAGLFVGDDFLANGGLVQMRYDGNGSIDVFNKTVFIDRLYRKV